MEKQKASLSSQAVRFSLLELLAVAVICISLVAVAVPKYLQADTASDIAEAESELAVIAQALELYAVDHSGLYPFDYDSFGIPWYITDVLSTPVAYITSATDAWTDPFGTSLVDERFNHYRYIYFEANRIPAWPPCPFPGPYTSSWSSGMNNETINAGKATYGEWRLSSRGPDETTSTGSGGWTRDLLPYDPTNGVISDGDLYISELEYNGTPVEAWKEYE